MKIGFGMFVRNEEMFIAGALRSALNSSHLFDDFFVINYGSTDKTTAIVAQHGIDLLQRSWENDYGRARMEMVKIARERGNDWLFTLDGDETLDFENVRRWAESGYLSVSFTRRNLTPGGGYKRSWWPDIQCRGMQLDQSLSFPATVHETPHIDGTPCLQRRDNLLVQSAVIEHFSLLKPASEVDLKFLNYRRLMEGLPPLHSLPPDHVVGSEFSFSDLQPVL